MDDVLIAYTIHIHRFDLLESSNSSFSGVFTTAKQLDRETTDLYQLTITVSDGLNVSFLI